MYVYVRIVTGVEEHMKKQDSWTSEFRKMRFYERRNGIREKREENSIFTEPLEFEHIFSFEEEIPLKTIAIMLDLDGTCDGIDDEKAEIFIDQVSKLRQQFGGYVTIISISTHYPHSDRIKEVLSVMEPHLVEGVEFGESFYFGGSYDYNQDIDYPRSPNFNINKLETFVDCYVDTDSYFNEWFAIIDDGIGEDVYKKYQDRRPMFLCRPSQNCESSSNNFMKYDTTTFGFDGVIEGLKTYIESVNDLHMLEVLLKQKNMMRHLSSLEMGEKIRNREYAFVERYLREGYATANDYQGIVDWLNYTDLYQQSPTENERENLKNILDLTEKYFTGEKEYQKKNSKITRVKTLKKSLLGE